MSAKYTLCNQAVTVSYWYGLSAASIGCLQECRDSIVIPVDVRILV
jgi:hypothetical protein